MFCCFVFHLHFSMSHHSHRASKRAVDLLWAQNAHEHSNLKRCPWDFISSHSNFLFSEGLSSFHFWPWVIVFSFRCSSVLISIAEISLQYLCAQSTGLMVVCCSYSWWCIFINKLIFKKQNTIITPGKQRSSMCSKPFCMALIYDMWPFLWLDGHRVSTHYTVHSPIFLKNKKTHIAI